MKHLARDSVCVCARAHVWCTSTWTSTLSWRCLCRRLPAEIRMDTVLTISPLLDGSFISRHYKSGCVEMTPLERPPSSLTDCVVIEMEKRKC